MNTALRIVSNEAERKDYINYFIPFVIFCVFMLTFAVRDTQQYNEAHSFFKTVNNKKGWHTGESPAVLPEPCFGVSRSDHPYFYNLHIINVMRDTKGHGNAISVPQTATVQLPVTNKHGIPVLQDFLTEVQRRFDVEKNIKNNLFAFIMEKGLVSEFQTYSIMHDIESTAGKDRAIAAYELSVSPEFKN